MQKWREWQAASDSDWSLASRREAVIRPLADQIRLTEATVAAAAKQLDVSRATLYRLIDRYQRRPRTSSLLPWKRGRGQKSWALDLEREKLIESCIRDFYLTSQRPSVTALMQEIRRCFSAKSLASPNYRTVRRRLRELDAFEVTRSREGTNAAHRKFGPVKTSSLRPLMPLEVVQIDHTLIDVIVVDQQNRLPIGRPYLSLAVGIAQRFLKKRT